MNSSVTVVIATRDRPELLRRALASIEAQTWSGTIETICVFDQSPVDTSLERVGGNRPIRAVSNARTPGLAGGRNTGIMLAQSKWVAFCDDDDEWLAQKIEAQLQMLDAADDALFATCGILIRYEDDEHERIPDASGLTFAGFLRDRMTEVHPSSFLMDRRWLIDEIGLVDEELPGSYAEDYELLLRVSKATTIVSVPRALVRIHWHPSTYFRDRWSMIDEALGHLVDSFPEFADEPQGLARIRGQQAFARAAAGRRREAVALIRETAKINPREPRLGVAMAVVAGVPPQQVLNTLHRFGRGL